MSPRQRGEGRRVGRRQRRAREGHVPRIEAYETDNGTVIFDGENPLAWVHSTDTRYLHLEA